MPFVKGDMESQRVQYNPLLYNQATTKLAFQSNETSKDVLSIMLNWLYRARQSTQKLAHFCMFITLKLQKVVEKFVKKLFYGQCVPTTYDTEIKETYFEIYIYQESCPLALPL